MNEYKPTMKYYIPTPKKELDKRIAHEKKLIEKAKKRIAKIESLPARVRFKNELEVQLDAVKFCTEEIERLKNDHFAKKRAIDKELREHILML